MIITIPKNVKRAIETASVIRECSESEVVRIALYYHLKEYIENEEKYMIFLNEIRSRFSDLIKNYETIKYYEEFKYNLFPIKVD